MGSFFTNLQVRSDDRKTVVDALRSAHALPSYVTEPEGHWVTVYPEATEEQDYDILKSLVENVSKTLSSAVFGFMVHDSDIFAYVFADKGKISDEYDSAPGYFEGEESEPSGGAPAVILPYCLPGTEPTALEELLKKRKIDSKFRVPINMDEWRANAEQMKQNMVEQFELQKHNLEAMGLSEEAWTNQLQAFDQYFAGAEKQIQDNGGFDIVQADDLAAAFATMLGIDRERACLGFNYVCEESDEQHAEAMLVEA